MSDTAPESAAEPEIPAELYALLEGYMVAGLAGGRWTWTEWLAAGPGVRAAAEQVARTIMDVRDRAQAALLATAMGGNPSVIADVLDDPAVRREAAEREVAARCARGRNGEGF